MDPDTGIDDQSIESEFARMYKYIDLYFQQKTDLLLQHYVFEPFDFLFKRIMCLSVIVTLLAAGTLALVIGVILLLSTVVPLWGALLIMGAVIFATGGIFAYIVLLKKLVLKTPTAEMLNNGKP
jgi:hypothetical protein